MATLAPAPPVNLGSGYPPEPVIDHILAQPGVQKVPSPKLTLFLRKRFLTPEVCAALCAQIDAQRRPSTVSDFNGDSAFRTSETCDLDTSDTLVAQLEQAITAFCGLDGAHGEPIQGQRYAMGQEFKAHTDYFEPQGVDFQKFCSVAGNRTWTVMLYLNEPEAGGATRFKAIDKMVHPETGKLLAWNNLRPDGTPNPATLHHGMKVRAGTKYVITKWYRERPWGWA
ncbi:prolyl hydroxylase family protein [Sphingomonas qomolangmaensis]|uniref:2OG-Fe(II) oxygenase n=1 Tax=Sphingomonas qomolangmaensis TaxID=2918765 RepID=A0ABY5LBW2_9SPHN|nr:2OG-Fe(II) oxygenase [Sphingomonas qomolangmaensis]UUL83219.1 2OG-Fe(II) oxygenase [Sphingomonas qomolangmaensis]